MNDLRVKSLKKIDADVSTMFKLNTVPTDSIDKFLKKMEQLIEEADSSFDELKGPWVSRLNKLKDEVRFVDSVNPIKEELHELQFYTQKLLDSNPTSESLNQTLDKFFGQINKIVTIKNKLTLGGKSLQKDEIEPNSLESSGLCSSNLSKQTVVTPKVTKTADQEKPKEPAIQSNNNIGSISNGVNFVPVPGSEPMKYTSSVNFFDAWAKESSPNSSAQGVGSKSSIINNKVSSVQNNMSGEKMVFSRSISGLQSNGGSAYGSNNVAAQSPKAVSSRQEVPSVPSSISIKQTADDDFNWGSPLPANPVTSKPKEEQPFTGSLNDRFDNGGDCGKAASSLPSSSTKQVQESSDDDFVWDFSAPETAPSQPETSFVADPNFDDWGAPPS